jgi:hypothetical protein
MEQLSKLLAITIVLYIFGSVCAGTLNISEWNGTGRVTLAIIWLLLIDIN